MNEMFIIAALSKYTDQQKFPYQVANGYIYGWESDFWTMTVNGETREFEVKISRSDYFVDAKKDKHIKLDGANYFYYVCPEGLIKKSEVDPKYGLIYVRDTGRVDIIKKPRKLNDKVFDRWRMLCNKMYYKYQDLWRKKFIDKEITRDEYFAGFNIELEQQDTSTLPSDPDAWKREND